MEILLATVALAAMFALILLRVPIGISMAAVGIVGYALLDKWGPAMSIATTEVATVITNVDLAVIPLFLLMGNFANASGVSDELYDVANSILGRFRGGLAMATVGGCGLFGAICGSSLATTATFGRIALPQMRDRGYSPKLTAGCIAAGGNLGSMIPPSIVLVIYAIMAEQYIIDLFWAAIIPALILITLFLITISVYVRIYPAEGPSGEKRSLWEIGRTILRSWCAVIMVAAIAFGIYGGVFTVNEAAALGAILAIIMAFVRRRMTWPAFWSALSDTAASTAMIYTLIIGARIFNYFIVVSHLPDHLTEVLLNSGLSNILFFIILTIIYIILGSLFDTIAAMIITLPFILPIILDMGYSPVWWGIINLAIVEIGMITPPIGMNVFVLNSVVQEVPLATIFKGIVPFLFASLTTLVILYIFPSLSLVLVK